MTQSGHDLNRLLDEPDLFVCFFGGYANSFCKHAVLRETALNQAPCLSHEFGITPNLTLLESISLFIPTIFARFL